MGRHYNTRKWRRKLHTHDFLIGFGLTFGIFALLVLAKAVLG